MGERLRASAGWALVLALTAAGCAPARPGSHQPETIDQCQAPAPGWVRRPGRPGTLTVATVNLDYRLVPRRRMQDLRRLLALPGVDVIAWQEANTDHFRRVEVPFLAARGWRTSQLPGGPEVAVSWRRERLTARTAEEFRMHEGAGPDRTTHGFPARYVHAVGFGTRDGASLTLLNTHLNQHIEQGDGWNESIINARYARRHLRTLAEMWNARPGRLVIGVGDFNFDYVDDHRARPRGGISTAFAGKARSSFAELGITGLCPTRNTRYIDYAFVNTSGLRRGARFLQQASLGGFHSDHRPLVVRIALPER